MRASSSSTKPANMSRGSGRTIPFTMSSVPASSPSVVYDEPGIMVVALLNAQTYTETDVRADAVRCVELVRRCHREMPRHMTGPGAIFWVFHVLRDYAHALSVAGHRHAADLSGW